MNARKENFCFVLYKRTHPSLSQRTCRDETEGQVCGSQLVRTETAAEWQPPVAGMKREDKPEGMPFY